PRPRDRARLLLPGSVQPASGRGDHRRRTARRGAGPRPRLERDHRQSRRGTPRPPRPRPPGLARLGPRAAKGVPVLKRYSGPDGDFAWIIDPDGTKIALWQPKAK